MQNLKELIPTYEDFPKKGIAFKDILEVLQDPIIFKEIVKNMSRSKFIENSEAIIAIDSRGFIFGAAISLFTSKPIIFARKSGKLPGDLIEEEYDLEYGKDSLSIQKKALNKYNSFVIVDDLIATGGTVKCVDNLLKKCKKKLVGVLVVIELVELDARKKLSFPLESVLAI